MKKWSDENKVPVFCGEFGSYGIYAALPDRCRLAKDVVDILTDLNIPYTYWEWDQPFSFFIGMPDFENIYPCMKEAFRLPEKKK
jgi:hypothetical protein